MSSGRSSGSIVVSPPIADGRHHSSSMLQINLIRSVLDRQYRYKTWLLSGFGVVSIRSGDQARANREKVGTPMPIWRAEVSMAGSYSADLRGRVLAAVEAGGTPPAGAGGGAGGGSPPPRGGRAGAAGGGHNTPRGGGAAGPRVR